MATSLSPGILTLVVRRFSLKRSKPLCPNPMYRSFRLILCNRDKVPLFSMERCCLAVLNYPRSDSNEPLNAGLTNGPNNPGPTNNEEPR